MSEHRTRVDTAEERRREDLATAIKKKIGGIPIADRSVIGYTQDLRQKLTDGLLTNIANEAAEVAHAALRAAEAGARRAALDEAAQIIDETCDLGHERTWPKEGMATVIRSLASAPADASYPAADTVTAFEAAARWHDARYVELRDNSPKGSEGQTTEIVGAHMAAHYESAEHFRASAPAPPASAKPPRE